MVSTGFNGEPILIISLADVKILKTMLDTAETSCQTTVMDKIVKFLNDPQCLAWEKKNAY